MTVTTAPGVPQGITAANTADSVTLSWNAQKGADGYVVHFDNTEITVAGTTSTHRGLAPNTSHTYQIRAKNADGMGVYSNLKTIKTAAKTLQAPSGVKKSSSENSATISWGAVSGATGYAVKFNGTAYYTTATSKTFTGLRRIRATITRSVRRIQAGMEPTGRYRRSEPRLRRQASPHPWMKARLP